MTAEAPRFQVGELVSLRVDRTRQGPVMQILPPVGGRPRYRVFHAPGDMRDYYEEQLVAVPPATDAVSSIAAALAGAAHGVLDAATFRARLTAARLSNPQIDHLYALHAARIRFVPFQLKPLLRFLHADQPRLLIADEVGVGKTIEAGLILREMQARQQVGNVLIVCPKALVSKWRAEMRRFDEQFDVLDGAALRYCRRETDLDGVWPQRYSRAIVHLELLRSENHLLGDSGRHPIPGLLTLSPTPRFSLVIVDEAHHLRNPETRSHEIARFLCEASDAVLFLSGTPVHLGSQDLFTLLHLLRPDLFPDWTVFKEMVEPNQYINTAMRYVRHPELSPSGDWRDMAAKALEAAGATRWGSQTLRSDPRFSEWLARLRTGDNLTDIERIRCLRDLEEVHTLAHVMNRTRRRDIGRFTIREPHTVSVPFTPEQEALYRRLIEFRRRMLLQVHDPIVVRLITDTLERQASSCLPALVPLLDHFLRTGRFSAADITDDDEAQGETGDGLPPFLTQHADELRALAAALPPEDPKLERLLEIAENSCNAPGPGKLLVFSYFLHTLGYLYEHLLAEGYRTAVITGKTPDVDRESLRDRFRLPREDPDALDVLLSSEVGCEGLDYEICHRLVNYDIPWNPMRIEQRIGRIDRFGQRSDKVLIYNFITPGTVEERIFFRCFERIGIFRDTVGDLEEILGEAVRDLTRAALDPTLTPEQQDQLARQMTDNVIRVAEEQQRLEDESATLLGLEQAFVDEVDDLIAEGRFVAPAELVQMIDRYLDQPDMGGRLLPDPQEPRLYRLRVNRSARGQISDDLRAMGIEPRDRTSVLFQRFLDGDEPLLPVTFDQAFALDRRDLVFVTPVHPLARVATRYWTRQQTPMVARLLVESDDQPAGRYLFICDLWETIAMHPEVRIVAHAWDIDRAIPAPSVAAGLIALLAHAETDTRPVHLPDDALNTALEALEEVAHTQHAAALVTLGERNDQIIARRVASLTSYYAARTQTLERSIAIAQDPRIRRMRQSERDRAEREHEARMREIDARRDADIVTRRVATGILTIRTEARKEHLHAV